MKQLIYVYFLSVSYLSLFSDVIKWLILVHMHAKKCLDTIRLQYSVTIACKSDLIIVILLYTFLDVMMEGVLFTNE